MFEVELFLYRKIDFASNNLQWLIDHKTRPNHTKKKMTWFGIKWPEKDWYAGKKTTKPPNKQAKLGVFGFEENQMIIFFKYSGCTYLRKILFINELKYCCGPVKGH